MAAIENYALLVAVVFAINLLPAFGPPTSAVLILFYVHQDFSIPLIVAAGALSAASGRLVLAQATRGLRRFLSQERQANLQAAGAILLEHRGRSLSALALFALSPVPSAQLFEAAGLVAVRLLPLTAAFFVGRTVSYAFYVTGAGLVSGTKTGQVLLSSLTSPWAVILQFLMLAALVVLARVDWTRLVHRRTT